VFEIKTPCSRFSNLVPSVIDMLEDSEFTPFTPFLKTDLLMLKGSPSDSISIDL
jgi:hypothetical protein